jgi:Flp pilus assembly protein TadG
MRFRAPIRHALDPFSRWTANGGTQIVEFALSLPLLVVFVVGIFDFSQAVTLKQKMTNAALEGARVAASDPANDLNNSLPVSVADAFYVVDNYLLNEKMNDCGLSTQRPARTTGLTWSSTGTSCSLVFTINRGFCASQTGGGGCTSQTVGSVSMDLIATQVQIQYPYKWEFSNVIGLLVPSAVYSSTLSINTSATAFNEN